MHKYLLENPLARNAESMCYAHGRGCRCLQKTQCALTMAVGGHTCTDDSSRGGRAGLNGKHIKVAMLYLHERRSFREDLFLDECVLGWRESVTWLVLEDLYHIEVVQTTPVWCGFLQTDGASSHGVP